MAQYSGMQLHSFLWFKNWAKLNYLNGIKSDKQKTDEFSL